MTRDEFLTAFIAFIIKRSNSWLPEESTEADMFDCMTQQMTKHDKEIQDVLKNHKI